ncbi:DUF699-domain-containing protein [Choiromyces venosus 120613-1]|uniref:RNA cytidine acetyltransferase n=1 Tax=Choiromyces venosus 120613-1 TaxID=1336337 RepID=A0A3N4JM19_9PEZI|nr:DUF699-domain-containing protein [Choiromyces venosus 120613-1]
MVSDLGEVSENYEKKRSFFVVVGNRGKDVNMNLHYILGSADPTQNKSVLWAYKKDFLGFSSYQLASDARAIKKEIKPGILDANTEDPFELFISLTNIRYCYYKETEKILGNTYGMCTLQDFEALNPNLLARTIETVEGGGLVILLLKTLTSLQQLYTMTMKLTGRSSLGSMGIYLSLADCASCLVVDDKLNVLPILSARGVTALPPVSWEEGMTEQKQELLGLKESRGEGQPVGSLVDISKTVDQAKTIMTFADTMTEKPLRSTVTLTAGQGRGKSAALGVAVSAAIAHGPENLKILFEFVFKSFEALNDSDHLDYDIIQSKSPAFNQVIVRVKTPQQHWQTIQYNQPQDAHVLGQAELVVIDEAAAIPLPLVKKVMGPYLGFMASTITGYEGTGRSLSLKLIQQLREQSSGLIKATQDGETADRSRKTSKESDAAGYRGRSSREAGHSEPIRYAPNDPIEKWLNNFLYLDAILPSNRSTMHGTPDTAKHELFCVNRDTLSSYHSVLEQFLQCVMRLYIASHYKNSPNDLQLMSNTPSYQLLVLLPPVQEGTKNIPDPPCVIHVELSYEGLISRESVQQSLAQGKRDGGDMIPWLVSQQFQNEGFTSPSGAQVVQIVTNPDYTGMGYGSRFQSLDEGASYVKEQMFRVTDEEIENSTPQTDNIKIRGRESLPPLLLRMSEKRPDTQDYIGLSCGLTDKLHKLWKKQKFASVYLRQMATELIGEHSCVMIKTMASKNNDWLGGIIDFHKRFLTLDPYEFRIFPAVLASTIFESENVEARLSALTKAQLGEYCSPFDLKRQESYTDNILDYHIIVDVILLIAPLHFTSHLRAIGLPRKTLEDIEKELNLPPAQVATCFRHLSQVISKMLAQEVGKSKQKRFNSEDLQEGREEVIASMKLKEKRRELINSLDLSKYEIPSTESGDWESAGRQIKSASSKYSRSKSTIVSVKIKSHKKRKAGETATEIYKQELGKVCKKGKMSNSRE